MKFDTCSKPAEVRHRLALLTAMFDRPAIEKYWINTRISVLMRLKWNKDDSSSSSRRSFIVAHTHTHPAVHRHPVTGTVDLLVLVLVQVGGATAGVEQQEGGSCLSVSQS